MARVTHPAQVDLRFGGPAREFSDFGTGVGPGDFARERFHLLGERWIGTNGQAQAVAKCVLRCVSTAPLLRAFDDRIFKCSRSTSAFSWSHALLWRLIEGKTDCSQRMSLAN